MNGCGKERNVDFGLHCTLEITRRSAMEEILRFVTILQINFFYCLPQTTCYTQMSPSTNQPQALFVNAPLSHNTPLQMTHSPIQVDDQRLSGQVPPMWSNR